MVITIKKTVDGGYEVKCPFCDKIMKSYSKRQLAINAEMHIVSQHRVEEDTEGDTNKEVKK